MPYAELHARTNFSFLDGASRAEELLARARTLKLSALAITDVNGLYGVVEARDKLLQQCGLKGEREHEADLRLIYGSELQFDDDVAVAIARTHEGYSNLSEAVSVGRLSVEKGEFQLSLDQLAPYAAGLTLLAGGPRSAVMKLLSEGNTAEAEKRLARLREIFGEHLVVELVRHLMPGDRERSVAMAELAKRLRIPIVATNDVHFHVPARKRLHDVLRCIKEGTNVREAGRLLLPNAEAHLKHEAQMRTLFKDLPEAVAYTGEIVRSVSFCLSQVKYRPPPPRSFEGQDLDVVLAELSTQGLREKLPAKVDHYLPQLKNELSIIKDLGYAGYFLMMKHVVLKCAELGILCQGRGSAANSLVCYTLGVTAVSPETINMLFERFLSKERAEPPDIDLDIEHERREEIIQYVYQEYGRDHAGMVAEVIRFRRRSALGEVGKALGFSEEQLHRLTKFMSHMDSDLGPRAFAAAGLDPANPMFRLLYECMNEIEDFPRHLSIHVGGFVLSDEPLARSVPIENGRMADRTVIQWNKDDVDSMGMFKLDLLGLGMLTVLSKTFALIEKHRGKTYTLQTVPQGDFETYRMLQQADSVGVFQVESRAQMSMLPRLKPRTFYDLVIEVAIVRPGPIQGDMVHPYLRRREGKDPIDYPHPATVSFLQRTLGVPLFQEQAMRLSMAVGGYTPGEANELRRSMASWGRNGSLGLHKEKLTRNFLANGLTPEMVERLFKQLEGFSAYGFPESHAAAFAHLAYVSAYLKCHYPAEFACGLLNAQPMGFYSPAVIINDARLHGVRIRPIDVQRSDWFSTIESGEIRLGLGMVRGLPQEQGEAIARARAPRPFTSIEDLAARAGLNHRHTTALAAAGGLASLHERRQAIWKAALQSPGPLFAGVPLPEPDAPLEPLDPFEELRLDITYGRAFPGQHPMGLLRPAMERKHIYSAADVKRVNPGRIVRVAGIVITRQRPGQGTFVYVTLEDETGHIDIAIPFQRFQEYEDVIRLSPALVVKGVLQGEGDARNIAGRYFEPLEIQDMPAAPSHDFH